PLVALTRMPDTAPPGRGHPTHGSGSPARKRGNRNPARREGLAGYVFLSPWLLGLLGITAIPMALSLYLSFTNYDILTPISEVHWIGLANYKRMFTAD